MQEHFQKTESVPKDFVTVEGVTSKLGSNLGPTTAKLGPKPCTMTQNKARRTNKIDFLQLPWAQEAPGSNPGAPTTSDFFPLQSDSESARVPDQF